MWKKQKKNIKEQKQTGLNNPNCDWTIIEFYFQIFENEIRHKTNFNTVRFPTLFRTITATHKQRNV